MGVMGLQAEAFPADEVDMSFPTTVSAQCSNGGSVHHGERRCHDHGLCCRSLSALMVVLHCMHAVCYIVAYSGWQVAALLIAGQRQMVADASAAGWFFCLWYADL